MRHDVAQPSGRGVHVPRWLRWNNPEYNCCAAQGQQPRHGKDAGQADMCGQDRACDQRQCKHQADTGTHQRHGLGADFIACQVGEQRGHCRRYRPGALYRTPDHQFGQRGGPIRQKAPGSKQQQPENDDGLAPQPVRRHPERQLQDALGQAIDTHGQADQGRIVTPRVMAGFQGKHRQYQEQAQHAQAVDGCQ